MLFSSWSWNTRQLFNLLSILKGVWEFAKQLYKYFVDLKAFNYIPRGVLWWISLKYEVSCPLLQSLTVRAWSALPATSQTCLWQSF